MVAKTAENVQTLENSAKDGHQVVSEGHQSVERLANEIQKTLKDKIAARAAAIARPVRESQVGEIVRAARRLAARVERGGERGLDGLRIASKEAE